MENSSASEIFMVIIRIIIAKPILTISKKSSRKVGRGIIKNRTMTTTPNATALSKAMFSSRFMSVLPSIDPCQLLQVLNIYGQEALAPASPARCGLLQSVLFVNLKM